MPSLFSSHCSSIGFLPSPSVVVSWSIRKSPSPQIPLPMKRTESDDSDADVDPSRKEFACEHCPKVRRDGQSSGSFLTVRSKPAAMPRLIACRGRRMPGRLLAFLRRSQSFGRMYELRRHLRSAHGNSVFECDMCGTRFSRQDALHRHKKRSATKPCSNRAGFHAGGDHVETDGEDRSVRRSKRAATARRSPRSRSESELTEHIPSPSLKSDPEDSSVAIPAAMPGHALPSSVDQSLLKPYPIVRSSYASVPSSLQLPLDVLESLIDEHAEYNGPHTAFHHFATFKAHLRSGLANQTQLLAIIWSALTVIEPPPDPAVLKDPWPYVLGETYRRMVVNECIDAINKDYEAILKENAATDPSDLIRVQAIAAMATSVLKALVIARMCVFSELELLPPNMMGAMDDMVASLFVIAKLGELPLDWDDLRRNPHDLPAWIWNEERSRLLTMILVVDAVSCDSWNAGPPKFLGRPGSQIEFNSATGRFSPAWANLALPCPDLLFERLPAASSSPDEDKTSIALLEKIELRAHGEAYTWMDLPRESARRQELLRIHGSGILRRGYVSQMAFQAGTYAKFHACKTFFARRGYRLYMPPDEQSPDEIAASKMRRQIVEGINDWIGSFPPEIRAAVEESDGQLLKSEAARWWGKTRRRTLAHSLAFLFTFAMVLNCPYDIMEQHGDPIPDDAWPFSPAFVLAESSAISISRLIKSYLNPHFQSHVDEPPPPPPWNKWPTPMSTASLSSTLELNEEEYLRYRKDELRRIPPLWLLVVLRACWVHVIGMRKLRLCLLSESVASNALMLRTTLETVDSLVGDVVNALDGMEHSSWRHTAEAYRIIRSWADVVVTNEASVWVGPTKDEMDFIRGKG